MSEIALYTLYGTVGCFIIAVVGLYLNVWDRIKPFLIRFLQNPFSLGKNDTDKLKIVNVPQGSTWQTGYDNNKEAIWLKTTFSVTNTSDLSNELISARPKKYKTHGVINAEAYSSKDDTTLFIKPGATRRFLIFFIIYIKHPKANKTLSFDFVFVDKLQNTYLLKNVLFDSTQKRDK